MPDWKGDGNVWESYRRTCDPSSQARRLFGSLRAQLKEGQVPISRLADAGVASDAVSEDFDFPEGVDDKYDFCNHPWAHYNQGHFFSDWRTIHALYPMFSPAKGVGYSDILIPSHYYFSSTKRYTYGWDPVNMRIKDVDDMEVPWEFKSDDIFWRGATTGGGSSPPGFLAQYQRHRFIKMTSDQSDAEKTVVFADPPGTNNFVSADVPIAQLNEDMMDVAFTKAVGCTQYPGGCDGMRKDHRFADAVPLGENWRHKYLIDVDGMGYSARLFALVRLCLLTRYALISDSSNRKVPCSNRPCIPNSCLSGSSHGYTTSQSLNSTKRFTTYTPTSQVRRPRCFRRQMRQRAHIRLPVCRPSGWTAMPN